MSFKSFSTAASIVTSVSSPNHIAFLMGGCLNIHIADPWLFDTDYGPWDEPVIMTQSTTPTPTIQLLLPAVAIDAQVRRQQALTDFNAAIDAAVRPQLALPPARITRWNGLLVMQLLLALPVEFHQLLDGNSVQPIANVNLRRQWAEQLAAKVRAAAPAVAASTVDDCTAVIKTARAAYKRTRCLLNRARFNLASVLRLIARRAGTARCRVAGLGFTANQSTARTVRAPKMNKERRINQQIARVNRKRRQKHSSRKLRRPLTTKQRAAARKQRKVKAVWKADRLGYEQWLRIYAHRGGQVTRVTTYRVVTLRGNNTAIQRPVTRTMKSDTLRRGNSRFQLANGVETPMANVGKFRRPRRTEDQLPLSTHYHRMMADGSYNRRKDGQSALSHLYGGVKRQQEDWKPCWTYEPLFEEGLVGEEDQFDEWDDPLEPWQEDYHQHQLAVEAYESAASVMDELFAWQLVDVQDMVAETVIDTVRCEYGAVGDMQMALRLEVLSPVKNESDVFGHVVTVKNQETGEVFTLGCAHCCNFTKQQLDEADKLEGCYTPLRHKDDPRMLLGYHPDTITQWHVEEVEGKVFVVLDADYSLRQHRAEDVGANETDESITVRDIDIDFYPGLPVHREDTVPNLRILERIWQRSMDGRDEEAAIHAFYRVVSALCGRGRLDIDVARIAFMEVLWRRLSDPICSESEFRFTREVSEVETSLRRYCEVCYKRLTVVVTEPEYGYAPAVSRVYGERIEADEPWECWSDQQQNFMDFGCDMELLVSYMYLADGSYYIDRLVAYTDEYEGYAQAVPLSDRHLYMQDTEELVPVIDVTPIATLVPVIDIIPMSVQADIAITTKVVADGNPTGMERFRGWHYWLEDNFGVNIYVIDRNDELEYGTARKFLGDQEINGSFHAPNTIYIVRKESAVSMTKTLFHEFGHYLVYHGFLSLKGNDFVRKYFRQVPKAWIASYSRWKREEEVVVDCFARWALDLEADRSLNAGFKQYLLDAKAAIGVAKPDVVVDYIAFEHGVPEQSGTTAGGRPASPASEHSGVEKVEGMVSIKEVIMLQNLIECFPSTTTVATLSNTLAHDEQHILGYTTHLVALMRNDAGEIIPCNLNLPVREQYKTDDQFLRLGLPDVVDEKYKLNHTSLGNMMGDEEPVLFFGARAWRKGAPGCAGHFFGIKGWYRNLNNQSAQVQLVFNELVRKDSALVMSGHVNQEVDGDTIMLRQLLKQLMLNGTETKQLGDNAVESTGLLAAMPEANKRYWFVVIAEVNGVHGFGQRTEDGEFDSRFKQRRTNVDVVDGQVVGDVKNDKKVIQTRFYCNHMTILAVADPNVMFDPDAVTHYNSNYYEALVDTVYGDGFLRDVKTLQGGFFASEFSIMKVTGDPRLDLEDNARKWLIVSMRKGFRTGIPTVKPSVSLDYNPSLKELQAAQVEVTKEKETASTEPEVPMGINISSYETGLGHQLSNLAALPIKFFGVDYKRSEDAYQTTEVSLESLADDNVLGLMVEILEAKLVQHRPLLQAISDRGGAKFLVGCTHNPIKNGKVVKPDRWTGKDGLFMQALRKAYDNLVNGGPEYQLSVYNAAVKPDMTSLADALTPPAVDTSLADELKAYYESMTTVDKWSLNDSVNWEDFSKDKFASWVSANTVTKDGVMQLNHGLRPASYACHCYLAACMGVDAIGNLPLLSGYRWEAKHFEDLVNIIRSYIIAFGSTENADQIIKFVDGAINIENSTLVYLLDDIGVIDIHRDRMFKGIIDVVWENVKLDVGTVKVVRDVVAASSYGAFMRFFYYGYIALLSGKLMSFMKDRNIGQNLKSFHTKYDKYFPVTSDGTVNMSGPTIHAEACGFNIVGTMQSMEPTGQKDADGNVIEVAVVHKPELMEVVNGKLKVKDFAGAGAEKLTEHYKGYRLRGEIKDSGILEEVIFTIAKSYSMGFSFNKGTGLRGDLVHVDCGRLAQQAPKWYARLQKRVAKLGYSGDLNGFFVNLNTKSEKGSKRILLRAATSVPSGCVIDVEGRPLLAAALANGRGVKYDNQAARTVAPGFYAVEGGYKSYTQERPLIGTAQRVALGMTIIGPAGEAWHLTGKNHRPTGFVTKKMSYKSSMYKRGAGLHIDTGTILMGCGYDVTQESQYGINYTYYRPQALQEVACGDVLAHVDTGVMLDGNRPYLRAVKQTRDVKGYLEWVRTYEVCSMSSGKNNQQLVVEWAITWKEDWAKIRSSVAKGMLVGVKKEFLFNSDNPGVTERLVDVLYPQDVIKADTLHCFIPIIGHTLVLNPDCDHPDFLWMVNRAMDINELVQGRRHLDYLVECPVAIADGLYDELQERFCAFFGRQITVDWQQLGSAEHGDALLALYQADVKTKNKFDVSNVKHINSNPHVIAISDVDLNNPANIGTPAETRANIFWFYSNPARTKVLRYKQRGWALVGREDCDCPIYDVVLFESSTVKEAAGESTQLGSAMRSNYRLMGCETIRDIMMGQAVRALEEPYRAKLLCAGYDGSMGNSGNEVINLCSWASKKERGETVWYGVPNQEGLAKVHKLLAGINLNDPEDDLLFERICFALRNVVLRIQTNSSRALKTNHIAGANGCDEEGYYDEESIIKVGHFDVYAPLLFNLNSLKSGSESLDTMSGMFFYQYLIVLLAGQLPSGIDVNRIRGKLRALVESENTAKNINGDTLVGGKAISLPNIPTWMTLISDRGRQYDLMKRHVRQYEHAAYDHEAGEYVDETIRHNLDRDCPSFADATAQGIKAYRTPIFNHETRAPMPDGPVGLVTLLPNTVKDLKNFYYAPSDLEFIEYVDGKPLTDRKTGQPVVRIDNIYPDVRILSTAAHNLMTAGDNDGDGTYGAIMPWLTKAQQDRLFTALTTLEYALNFRANAVGRQEGESAYDVMLRKECYWGDYMMTKNGFARYKIAEQLGSFIRVGSKNAAIQHSTQDIQLFKEENGQIVMQKNSKGKLEPVVVSTVVSYSAVNACAREVFATMVGVSYGIYQIAEAVVDIVTALVKADVEVPARFRWATRKDAMLVVSAVAEVYETILGAYKPSVWHLWKFFMELTAKPKTGQYGVKSPNYITPSTVEAFAEAIEGIGCNGQLGNQIANCFNIVADIKCWEKGNLANRNPNPALGLDTFIMYVALAQFEMGRGKWLGYMKGYLNGANEWDEKKTLCHQSITAQLFHWFALGNTIGDFEMPEAAFEHSHVLWVMRTLFQPEVMGDVCQYQPGAGYIFADKDGVRPAMDYFRYKLELRAGKQEDNNMEIDPIVDVTTEVVESIPETIPVQAITWLHQPNPVDNGSNDQDDDGGVGFYDSDMPDCPDDDGYCGDDYSCPDIPDDGQVHKYVDDGEEISMDEINAAIATATTPAPVASTSVDCGLEDDQVFNYHDDGEEISTAEIEAAAAGQPAPEPIVVVQQPPAPVIDIVAQAAESDETLAKLEAHLAAAAQRLVEESARKERLAKAQAMVEKFRAQFGDEATTKVLAKLESADSTNGSCSDDKDEPEEPTGGVAAPKPQPKPSDDGGAAVSTEPVQQITTTADSISHESAEPTGATSTLKPILFSTKTAAYKEFSNFLGGPCLYNGITFKTAEGAFQYAKIDNPTQQQTEQFANCDGHTAKRLGRKVKLCKEWEMIKLQVMKEVLLGKFNQQPMKDMLLNTGDRVLLHHAPWEAKDGRTSYWGVDDNGNGENWMGEILMEVREILRSPMPVEDNKKQEVNIVPTIKEATPVVQAPAKATAAKVTYTPGIYTACQQKFMDLVAEGHHIFLTGKAGTGKTYITSECIHRWAANGDKVVAFGTTGISVMNLAGNLEDEAVEALGTVNSGFALGIAFDDDDRRNENDWQWANVLIGKAKANNYVKQNLQCKAGQRLRVVIDEVSMLDARLLYIVMQIIKFYNPFAQVLLVGDGGQLPVVGDDAVKFYKQAIIDGCLMTLPYLFGDFKVIELQTGVRQKDDRAFEEALDHLRETGEVTGVILERFKQCLEGLRPANMDDVTYIYFNNKRVEEINERRTAEMTTAKRTYRGEIIRKAATNDNWVREFRPIPVELTLAIAMPVKLRVNIYKIVDSKKVLVAANGSRGRVTKLANDYVEVDFGDGKPLAIGIHEFTGRRLPNGSLSGKFMQLPLHADFATTINSCQGLTITNPGVCGVFEDVKGETVALTREAALYVMLSRFTRIEDVYFDVSDPRAVNWFIGSQGHVDTEYFEWLKANRH